MVDNLHPQVHATRERPAALHEAAELVVADVVERRDLGPAAAGPAPRRRGPPGGRDGHRAVAEREHPPRLGQRGRHDPAARRPDPGRPRARPRRAHQQPRGVRRGHLAATPTARLFQPGARTHAQLEAAQWDFPGADARAQLRARQPRRRRRACTAPPSSPRSTCSAPWAGSHDVPLSVLRLQNVYGPGQSLTNPYTGIVSLFSQLARDGRVDPALRGRRDHPRLRLHRRRGRRALVAAIGRAADHAGPDLRRRRRRPHHDPRPGARPSRSYHDAPEPHVTGQYRDGDVRHASCDVRAHGRRARPGSRSGH